MQTEGIICYIPETPRKPSSTYVPYIFDENEWNRIIMEADKLADSLKQTGTDMPIVFPMLIRILYVCGLRVSEALSLQVKDVDFTRNCLNIQKAKRKRQRLVPIKKSTADLLYKYFTRRGMLSVPEAYVFACEGGKPPSQSWIQRWFAVTLEKSGIHQVRQHPGERGICPHCIRHTFTFRSFQNYGDTFENTVPFFWSLQFLSQLLDLKIERLEFIFFGNFRLCCQDVWSSHSASGPVPAGVLEVLSTALLCLTAGL